MRKLSMVALFLLTGCAAKRPVRVAERCAPDTVPGIVQYCHAVYNERGEAIHGRLDCEPITACARLDEKTGRVLDVMGFDRSWRDDEVEGNKDKEDVGPKKHRWWAFWRTDADRD